MLKKRTETLLTNVFHSENQAVLITGWIVSMHWHCDSQSPDFDKETQAQIVSSDPGISQLWTSQIGMKAQEEEEG